MNAALRILNIIAIIALTLVICIWGQRIVDEIRYRPMVIKLDKLQYDIQASDGTRIFILEELKTKGE